MISPLRASVRSAFYDVNAPLEGVVAYLYADVKNYLTVGVGALVDPLPMALALPFRRSDGSLATKAEIAADWYAVKRDPDAARLGHRYVAQRGLARLHLDEQAIRDLVTVRLDANVADLVRRYPGFPSWCASEQMGVLSMSWALGSGFEGTHPKCAAALQAGDLTTVIAECAIKDNEPRSRVQRHLFEAAALVVERGLSPEPLYLTPDAVPAPEQEAGPSREAREAYAQSVLATRAQMDEMARRGRRDD